MTTLNPHRATASLYRSLLRETAKLPHIYLRLFYRVKIQDDFRSDINRQERKVEISAAKAKRLSQELKRLRAANAGKKKAFQHVLDVAYGRKGKLKYELLKPFLADSDAPKPPRIISAVERSRPPVYSPPLAALLTSVHSRTTKALKPKQVQETPLPARADPTSEEARLLGPFSRRRRVNLLWRYFTVETNKVLPPLEVSVVEKRRDGQTDAFTESAEVGTLRQHGVRGGAMQGSGVLQHLLDLVGPAPTPRQLTRRERRQSGTSPNAVTVAQPQIPSSDGIKTKPLPSGFLRHRHKELLGNLPLLTFTTFTEARKQSGAKRTIKNFEVDLPQQASIPHLRFTTRRNAFVDDEHLAWICRADPLEFQVAKSPTSAVPVAPERI